VTFTFALGDATFSYRRRLAEEASAEVECHRVPAMGRVPEGSPAQARQLALAP